jgi:hypothetical protein
MVTREPGRGGRLSDRENVTIRGAERGLELIGRSPKGDRVTRRTVPLERVRLSVPLGRQVAYTHGIGELAA